MKVTALHRQPGTPVAAAPRMSHHPGSAVFHGGKPFFVPGVSDCWEVRPAIALRLCRLGKSIAARFAPRYYDAVAPALFFVPADIERQPGMDGMISAIDNTVAIAPWQPLPPADTTWTIHWQDEHIDLSTSQIGADTAIEVLSRFMTIQMGDALVPFILPDAVPVTPGESFMISLDDGDTFTVRTK